MKERVVKVYSFICREDMWDRINGMLVGEADNCHDLARLVAQAGAQDRFVGLKKANLWHNSLDEVFDWLNFRKSLKRDLVINLIGRQVASTDDILMRRL